MVSVKFISHNSKEFNPPQQLIVEGDEILFDSINKSCMEVTIKTKDGDITYMVGDDPSSFDRGFVMNEAGNTISVIKKPSEL